MRSAGGRPVFRHYQRAHAVTRLSKVSPPVAADLGNHMIKAYRRILGASARDLMLVDALEKLIPPVA